MKKVYHTVGGIANNLRSAPLKIMYTTQSDGEVGKTHLQTRKNPLPHKSEGIFRSVFASRNFAVSRNLFLASFGLFGVAALFYGAAIVVLQAASHVFQLARKPRA